MFVANDNFYSNLAVHLRTLKKLRFHFSVRTKTVHIERYALTRLKNKLSSPMFQFQKIHGLLRITFLIFILFLELGVRSRCYNPFSTYTLTSQACFVKYTWKLPVTSRDVSCIDTRASGDRFIVICVHSIEAETYKYQYWCRTAAPSQSFQALCSPKRLKSLVTKVKSNNEI